MFLVKNKLKISFSNLVLAVIIFMKISFSDLVLAVIIFLKIKI